MALFSENAGCADGAISDNVRLADDVKHARMRVVLADGVIKRACALRLKLLLTRTYRFWSNPVGAITIGAVTGLYVLLLGYARKVDRLNHLKVRHGAAVTLHCMV